MEIILKKDVENLGYANDVVKVRDGYARNFLLPRGLAVSATQSERKQLAETLKQRARALQRLRQPSELISSYPVAARAFKYLEGTPANVAQRILEQGEHEGRAYLVHERFEGRSLASWLAGHRKARTRPGLASSGNSSTSACFRRSSGSPRRSTPRRCSRSNTT